MSLFTRIHHKAKVALMAGLASVAPIGAAAVAGAGLIVNSNPNMAVPDALRPQKVDVTEATGLVGPGTHRLWQRPLTGLEIARVRKARHCFPTNRMARSKYLPDGIPCAILKRARIQAQAIAQAALKKTA